MNNQEKILAKSNTENAPEIPTISQAKMNEIAAKEKREGRASAYKSLGFSDENDAVKQLQNFKSMEAEYKNCESSINEARHSATLLKEELLREQMKNECLSLNIPSDYYDFVLSAAKTLINDETDERMAVRKIASILEGYAAKKKKIPRLYVPNPTSDKLEGNNAVRNFMRKIAK